MTGYIKAVGAKIAENQITNGGPIILVQAENEYSGFQAPYTEDFEYEKILLEQFVSVVNTALVTQESNFVESVPPVSRFLLPPMMLGLGDISQAYFWGSHLDINPEAPNAVWEFQGGAFDPWQGSAIAEDRTLREKYYEIKLQANFLAVTPAYLTSRPQNIYATQGSFTGNPALKTTQVLDVVGKKTGFYITDASSTVAQTYTLTVATSIGTLTIPTISGHLTLNGRDSKIHAVDYVAGSTNVLYSSAEIFTCAHRNPSRAIIDDKDVLFVYGNAGELHETALTFSSMPPVAEVLSGSGSIMQQNLGNNSLALQYITTGQTVVQVGSTVLYILGKASLFSLAYPTFTLGIDRANAYQFWVLHPPTSGNFARYNTENPIIIKGGHLVRSVDVIDSTLAIKGDLNSTTTFEIIAPSASAKSVTFNGEALELGQTPQGTWIAKRSANLPTVVLPKLSSLIWPHGIHKLLQKTADSLPEIKANYSDAQWTVANHTTTVNPTTPMTDVVLFAGDYGYHTGNILWRGHFNATGEETAFSVHVQGGTAFGFSTWLDSTHIGSWEGDAAYSEYTGTFQFPSLLQEGSAHVLTILQDHMGLEEDWSAASDGFKTPRGIINYTLFGTSVPTVSVWKVTGNLGGESFADKTRGGLNEGGLYGERQGKFDEMSQGILNYNGHNTLAVSLWAAVSGGGKLESLNLELTAQVETSRAPVVNAPLTPWSPRLGAY
ncbi:hypothetical protein C0993_002789 [Termitomyces sp. T159_Od127]|nr:hypothetical protein C0993_002789 [Termitomyces sp. T159_Od127]